MFKKNNIKKEENKINNKKNKIYIGFTARVFLYALLFLILFVSAIIFFLNSLNFIQQKNINYSENSNLDYNVYLKENEFYDTPYLGKDMLYIASLIDMINIYFDYNFTSNENINLNFNYKILGKLLIMDVDEKNTFFEREYILLDNKNGNMINNNNYKISENINIDYDYYNSLANKFRMSYGVDTSSKLIIYLIIDKNSIDDDITINNSNNMSITIPLSEKAVNIDMEYNEIDDTSYIVSNSNIIIDNIIWLIISAILIIISIVVFIKFIKLISLIIVNRNKYDKYVNRILNEYDRLIVETSTCPVISGNNVIRVDKFQELIDVRDNLKVPIMYYVVHKHHKCYFYITYGNKVYLNVIKQVDLEHKK